MLRAPLAESAMIALQDKEEWQEQIGGIHDIARGIGSRNRSDDTRRL
jgi:hypothetical protein